jgi:histidine triad (HIT) family protein
VDDCVFCKIAAGELPSSTVHESEEFLAFDDLSPKAEHHVLVIPRAHHGDLDAYVDSGASADRMLAFVAETARRRGIDRRYRLITNVGAPAGQVVFHLHWHVLAGASLPGF